jgi:hypothetical protein
MIYADIEPNWKCAAEWFHGWWKVMFDSPYGGMGGVYENPLKWNAPNFANPYLKALKGDSPFVFEDPPSKARYLYSQQPCKGCLKPKSITFDFVPAEPHGVRGTTVVWQYGIDCVKRGGTHGLIDMDLADARGYASMKLLSIVGAAWPKLAPGDRERRVHKKHFLAGLRYCCFVQRRSDNKFSPYGLGTLVDRANKWLSPAETSGRAFVGAVVASGISHASLTRFPYDVNLSIGDGDLSKPNERWREVLAHGLPKPLPDPRPTPRCEITQLLRSHERHEYDGGTRIFSE